MAHKNHNGRLGPLPMPPPQPAARVALKLPPGSVSNTHAILSAMIIPNATILCTCGFGSPILIIGCGAPSKCPQCARRFAITAIDYDVAKYLAEHPDQKIEPHQLSPSLTVHCEEPLIESPRIIS
jgi:hypothetical protein